MKVSESWLREWVNPQIDTAALVAQVTMAGLEVDAIEPVAGEFSGVIVGEIVAVDQHPDADKLRVCRVKGHPDGEQQVVCGAPNARLGIKVPFATVGAVLPGNFKIKKAKLRGVESFGMLCAQSELEAGDDDSGLWELPAGAPIGADLRDCLQLDDQVLELDLTPNRGDCLSVRGLAREVGVLNQLEVSHIELPKVPVTANEQLPVRLQAPAACPIYVGRVITAIDARAPSPDWLVEKLRRSGIRSIDAVVDVTNYVLLELGQPLHAFDRQQIRGGINVRFAEAGEKIVLLNEQELTLRDDTLLIADDEGPLAVAGIMGGQGSAVTERTQSIFLESAFFTPLAIAGKARSYGLHTDASHRYERGVDYQLQLLAIERATELLLNIVGGQAGPLIQTVDEQCKPQRKTVRLNRARLEQGLCLDLQTVDVPAMLQRLGLVMVEQNDAAWTFEVPSFRFDIEIEEDLLEEVARIYGYDRLPTRPVTFTTELQPHSETRTPLQALKHLLCARGFQEIITYSFIDPKLHEAVMGGKAVTLRNPISADMASMRTSLLPGLLHTLSHNLKRQHTRAKLFEVGMVFEPVGDSAADVKQEVKVAGLLCGSATAPSWANATREADFFDLKGDLEVLFAQTAKGRQLEFVITEQYSHLHPGQCADILLDGERVGCVGALHPSTGKALGLSKPVFLFECCAPSVLQAAIPKFAPLSRQPEMTRDLAVLVDKKSRVADLGRSIRKSAGDVLKDLKLFDVYSGEGIDPQRKSIAFSLTFQDRSRTLTDEEVSASMAAVVQGLEEEFGASLR